MVGKTNKTDKDYSEQASSLATVADKTAKGENPLSATNEEDMVNWGGAKDESSSSRLVNILFSKFNWTMSVTPVPLAPSLSSNVDFANGLVEDFKLYVIEKIPHDPCGITDVIALFNGFVENVKNQTPPHDPNEGKDIIDSVSPREGVPVEYDLSLNTLFGGTIAGPSADYVNDPLPYASTKECGAKMKFSLDIPGPGFHAIEGWIRVQEIVKG